MVQIRTVDIRKAGLLLIAATAVTALTVSSLLAGPVNVGKDRNSSSDRSRSRPESSSSKVYKPNTRTSPAAQERSGSVAGREKSGRREPSQSQTREPNVRTPSEKYRPSDTPRGTYKPSETPKGTYRPSEAARGTYRPTERRSPDRSSDRSYKPDSRRPSPFERLGERNKSRDSYRHKPEYKSYYSYGYYRPYTGWRSPYYNSGYYYYSWPHYIEPCNYGYYIWNHDPAYAYRSAYYYYGYYPYINRSRVNVLKYPVTAYTGRTVAVRDYSYEDYYLSKPVRGSIDSVLLDVKYAWTTNRPELIEEYIRKSERIAVFLDGSYSYSIDGSDYTAITRDAVDRIRTISFTFDQLQKRGDDRITAYGTHKYYDPDDNVKTVYVSYTFERYGSDWFITEAGSSDRPL